MTQRFEQGDHVIVTNISDERPGKKPYINATATIVARITETNFRGFYEHGPNTNREPGYLDNDYIIEFHSKYLQKKQLGLFLVGYTWDFKELMPVDGKINNMILEGA